MFSFCLVVCNIFYFSFCFNLNLGELLGSNGNSAHTEHKGESTSAEEVHHHRGALQVLQQLEHVDGDHDWPQFGLRATTKEDVGCTYSLHPPFLFPPFLPSSLPLFLPLLID